MSAIEQERIGNNNTFFSNVDQHIFFNELSQISSHFWNNRDIILFDLPKIFTNCPMFP